MNLDRSELIACGRESLLTKLTWPPTGMRTSVGVTPVAEIVMVASAVDGDEELLPHADRPTRRSTRTP